MASLDEFSLYWRVFLRAYQWRRIDPVPWARPRKALADSRIAIVTSAGLHTTEQPPFDPDVRGGDWSYRRIPGDVDPRSLHEAHRSELMDHSGIALDPNLAFPLDRLRELEREGIVGSVSREHASLMGSITAPGRLADTTAPEIAALFLAEGVDVALLVPV